MVTYLILDRHSIRIDVLRKQTVADELIEMTFFVPFKSTCGTSREKSFCLSAYTSSLDVIAALCNCDAINFGGQFNA